jgi:hypothetical protein
MNSISLPLNTEAQRFRQNSEAVTHLGNLLNDSVLRKALSIIRGLAVPRNLPDVAPGVHHDTTISHHLHFLMGVNKALEVLDRLATSVEHDKPSEDDETDREEFADYSAAIKKAVLPAVEKKSK